jgi:broad specificity phosphatase PhoE
MSADSADETASTRFLLLRHGSTDAVDVSLAGWQDSVTLNVQGEREIAQLARWLTRRKVDALYFSPIGRTQQSAAAIAAALDLAPQPAVALGELRFGDWTGKRFDELHADPVWHRFNVARSITRIPNGEIMLEAQTRAVALLLQLRAEHPAQCVALVTHGDVIKAVLSYFLGMPLDFYARLEISPASWSELELAADYVRVLHVNARAAIEP